MSLSNTVFIDRADRKSAIAVFEAAGQRMRKEKQSVFIFPEGTRSYYEKADMLPFKKGAFHLAIQAQVPIVPIVSANYSHIVSFKRKLFSSGKVPCKVLKPIETTGMKAGDVEDLMRLTRERMMVALAELDLVVRNSLANGTTSEKLRGKSAMAMQAS